MDHITFGQGILGFPCLENPAPVEHVVHQFQFVLGATGAGTQRLHGLVVDEGHAPQNGSIPISRIAGKLAPMNCTGAITRGRRLPPVTDVEPATVAINGLRDDMMFKPVVAVVVEHLVMDPGWQIDGISCFDRVTFALEQHLTGAGEDVVHLFEVLVLVVIRRFASLQGMAGKPAQAQQAIPFVIGITFDTSQWTALRWAILG